MQRRIFHSTHEGSNVAVQALLSLILLLATGLPVSGGLVLCTHADGHVEVERVGQCSLHHAAEERASRVAVPGAAHSVATPDCGSCSDDPLFAGAAPVSTPVLTSAPPHLDPVVQEAPATVSLVVEDHRAARAAWPNARSHRLMPQRSPLRTVVLLV